MAGRLYGSARIGRIALGASNWKNLWLTLPRNEEMLALRFTADAFEECAQLRAFRLYDSLRCGVSYCNASSKTVTFHLGYRNFKDLRTEIEGLVRQKVVVVDTALEEAILKIANDTQAARAMLKVDGLPDELRARLTAKALG
jgi:hypothetical protein